MARCIMKTHLCLHGLEISTHLCDLWDVSLCGRVWLSFCFTQFALSDAIPRLNMAIHCENGPLDLPVSPWEQSSHGFPSPSYWNLYWSINLYSKEGHAYIQLHSVLVDIFSLLQFHSKKGLKEKFRGFEFWYPSFLLPHMHRNVFLPAV